MHRIVIWGMGNFIFCKRELINEISGKEEIIAFTDSTCEGLEFLWGRYKTIKYKDLKDYEFDYICIASNAEWEIRKTIYDYDICDTQKIITFDELIMLYEMQQSLNQSYEKLEKALPGKLAQIMHNRKIYHYLVDKYSYVLFENKYKEISYDRKKVIDGEICPIWVFWHEGLQKSPEIVKACVRSIEGALDNNEKLFLIDKDNLSDYIELPEHIAIKWKNGTIGHNKFANIVRLRLLNTYGGVWIDATVFIMEKHLPEYITRNDLFFYHIDSSGLYSANPHMAANWLIASRCESLILKSLEALHYEYWEKEEKECDYFFFHFFLTMAANYYKEEWNKVEIVLRDPAQILCKYINDPYSEELIKDIAHESSIQKLSWKIELLPESNYTNWDYLRNNMPVYNG